MLFFHDICCDPSGLISCNIPDQPRSWTWRCHVKIPYQIMIIMSDHVRSKASWILLACIQYLNKYLTITCHHIPGSRIGSCPWAMHFEVLGCFRASFLAGTSAGTPCINAQLGSTTAIPCLWISLSLSLNIYIIYIIYNISLPLLPWFVKFFPADTGAAGSRGTRGWSFQLHGRELFLNKLLHLYPNTHNTRGLVNFAFIFYFPG